jgi:hypothetical protein
LKIVQVQKTVQIWNYLKFENGSDLKIIHILKRLKYSNLKMFGNKNYSNLKIVHIKNCSNLKIYLEIKIPFS